MIEADEQLADEVDLVELDPVENAVELLLGFVVVSGSLGEESFSGGESHSPATTTPKILMQGR